MAGHESEGTGVPEQEAEGELSLARIALAENDFTHTATHLANAVGCDPGHAPSYAMLGELIAAVGGIEKAIELFTSDGPQYAGPVAVLAALHARAGDLPQAVGVLANLVAQLPADRWAAAPWFGKGLVETVPANDIAQAVMRIAGSIGDPAPPELLEPLMPWLDLTRAVVGLPDVPPTLLVVLSALARRLGAADEAIAWCDDARRREVAAGEPTPHTAIMLGYAYRSAGRQDDAIDAWRLALEIDPSNVDVYVDLAETCIRLDRHDDALAWANQAALLGGDTVKPKAVGLAAAYLRTAAGSSIGDVAPLIELVDLVRANPEHPYPRALVSRVCRGRVWLNLVPQPTEAIANMAAQMMAKQSPVENKIEVQMTALESPSAIAAFTSLFPNSTMQVAEVPDPDIREVPRADFGRALWSYEGNKAVASVPPASPIAAEELYHTVTGYWRDPLDAYDRSVGFGGLDEAELLGLLAHVPPSPAVEPWSDIRGEAPMLWPRLAQAWVCVGMLHYKPEQQWMRSERRMLLLRLLFGAEDWTVDAAAFALCVSGWLFPEARADVAEAVARRYLDALPAAFARPTELHDPLAQVVLACPGVHEEVVTVARQTLEERAVAGDG